MLNVNCLSVEAPFSVFQQFGFQTGRSVDKFAGQTVRRSDNGLVFLDKYINAFMSLKVEQYVDLGTHGMFICSVTEARVMSDQDLHLLSEVCETKATDRRQKGICVQGLRIYL